MSTSFVKRGVVLTINLFNALSQHFLREVRYLTRYRRQATWKPSRHCHYNLVVPQYEQTALIQQHNTTLFCHTPFVYFNSISCQLNSSAKNIYCRYSGARQEYLVGE